MLRRSLSGFLVSFLVLWFLAGAPPAAPAKDPNPDAGSGAASPQGTGNAPERRPAIVVLERPSLAEHLVATPTPEERLLRIPPHQRLFTSAADDYRESLRRGKQDLAARLAARGMPLAGQTETVLNTLLVRATEDELEWLRGQPGVRMAEFAGTYHLELDAAVPLIGGTQAWATLGGEDNAGRGVRIAVVDSGIDRTHPMMSDAGFTAPPGFPKSTPSNPGDANFTNNKVIVAKNFSEEPDAGDNRGHGTFVAAVAAGRRAQSPLTSIAGVAPGAFLGNYKVFNATGTADSSAILQALDAAVADGMDIVNFSFGGDNGGRTPARDPFSSAIQTAIGAGVVVVVSAGNCGIPNDPDPTCRLRSGGASITSPATLPDAISVGASSNSRSLIQPVRVTAPAPVPSSLQTLPSFSGSEPSFTTPVGPAALVDVSQFDSSGQACSNLPAGALAGKIVLIQRGTCTFTSKINNATGAGAIGVVVYNNVSGVLRMNTTGATIPSVSITNSDGLALLAFVRANPGAVQVILDPKIAAFPETADLVVDFSSRGPSTDFGIKPDVMAPGSDIHSATQNRNSQGDLFSVDRFRTANGTSFSAPIVAGAAALVKQAHPRFSPVQIKSALVNTATPLTGTEDGSAISVMNSGAGKVNLPAALSATLVAQPVALSFGVHAPTSTFSGQQALTLTNVGTASDTFNVSLVQRSSDPVLRVTVDKPSFPLAAGDSATLNLSVSNSATLQASYEGFLKITSQTGSTTIHVPYWVSYAIPQIGGVVDAASFGSAVSPGSIVAVFGLALGGTPPSGATVLPLPTQLGGTALRINDSVNVPLFFSSTGQANAELPFDVPRGNVTAFVRLNGVAGPDFTFPIASFSPAIFTRNQSGSGPGAILHALTGQPVTSSNPAQAEEYVSIYCTGLGGVVSPPSPGAAAPSNPPTTTTTTPTVTIGGVAAKGDFFFSGLAPFLVGVYQINVQVPRGVPSGDRTLEVHIGGAASNIVTMAIQ